LGASTYISFDPSEKSRFGSRNINSSSFDLIKSGSITGIVTSKIV
jgi:hypothetical protein